MSKLKLSLITLCFISSFAQAEPWDEKFFNPKPLEGDVVLPMPCDGNMVFRVVKTNSVKPLEDSKITLGGNSSDADSYAQYATPNYISGSFSEKGKERYFLMGKYEITKAQYDAVMNEQCPAVNMASILPITNISWFDAVNFTNKYNEWLLKNAADKLPVEDGLKGFIRLPTNAEWEFASRGGISVDEGTFRENVFPIPVEDKDKGFAWTSKNANGKIQLIGRLAANPLGLFDTLGNASEMVFDGFKANKLNRYHGQEGGLVARGGSYIKSEADVNNLSRIEIPYYDGNGASKKKDMGFRVLISAPLLTSSARIEELRKEWSSLGSDDQEKEGVVGKLDKLASSVEDKKLKDEINKTKDELRAANQARDEQRAVAVRSALQLGGFLCLNLSDLQSEFNQQKQSVESFEQQIKDESDEELKKDLEQQMDAFKPRLLEAEKARDYVLQYYASTITSTFDTYNLENIKEQVERTKSLMNEKKLSSGEKAQNLTQYLDLYWSHLSHYYQNGKVQKEDWLKQCNNIKSTN